jgi:hypothetical protein
MKMDGYEVKQPCTEKIDMDHVMNYCGGTIHYLIRREACIIDHGI